MTTAVSLRGGHGAFEFLCSFDAAERSDDRRPSESHFNGGKALRGGKTIMATTSANRGLKVATVCVSLTAASAAWAQTFQLLEIGGAKLRWPRGEADRTVGLTYAIEEADGTSVSHGAVNCRKTTGVGGLLKRSSIDREHFIRAVDAAFARWQAVADVRFRRAEPDDDANIVITAQAEPFGHAFTSLTTTDIQINGYAPISKAVICLNPRRPWKIGFDGNLAVYDIVHAMTHEIGHALGLDHPGGRGHVMSFRYQESLSGLTDGDRAGAVVLYGPPRPGREADARIGREAHILAPSSPPTIGVERAFDGLPAKSPRR